MITNILVSSFAPFGTLTLAAPSVTQISDVLSLLTEKYPLLPSSGLNLSTHSGLTHEDTSLASLCENGTKLIALRLSPRVLGGKGGFGSQLRAAGGRMSSQKTNNNDSCRDLSGRRLSTLKEAKKLAEYLESEPERLAAKAEAQKAKLEALERRLGIDNPSTGAGPSRTGSSSTDQPAKLAGKKHRFDDTEYLEQSRELVDNVKSAVSAGKLPKKKKAKLSPDSKPATDAQSSKASAPSKMPTPVAVPAAPTEAVGA
ncbi:telomere stability and silencing-domain-containing protein [Lentinula aff. lateritia]|uniref:Telomere stability and silencing-domain-containing protein n=1 Tax=Lentinula aff. lateritia TaxID=2804960 RepID=A0ACC1TWY4_9AGAR|nr:telomere stability and silencing-domain-containing protein [Lentinula aff. lateritia]